MASSYTPPAPDKLPSNPNQTTEESELVGRLILDWQYLFGLRGNWNSHWTEIAERIYPMESYLFQNFSSLNSQGDKRNQQVYDSTGILALQRFGAILDSLLTPRDQFWHNLKSTDPVINRDKGVKLYFETVNNILFSQRYNPRTNFAAQNQGQYLSLGAYGTGVLFIDRIAGARGLRYKHIHLGECYLQENHQGLIDSLCRHFMLTARQAVQQFGERCPHSIVEQSKKFPEMQFFFLHWVKPRTDKDPDRKDYKGMDFASYYVSVNTRDLVQEGGYKTFPYAVSRYYQAPNEAYGRSIAMDVLPTLKTLNEQKKTMLKQGHRVVDPVLLAHDDGVIDGFSLEPGAINAGGISKDGRLLVQPLPTGSIQAGIELMQEEKNIINDSFLVTLFQILVDTPEMTATEVVERAREKGILLAPTIGRQNSEYLGPMIDRELDLLSIQGLLPPMPPLLKEARGEYKIEYDSPITRTQKSEWASGAARTFETLVNVATNTQDPSVLDYINMDVAIPAMAEIYGTPTSWMRSSDDIRAIRAQRAEAQAKQQAIEAMPGMAGMMKAMPKQGG